MKLARILACSYGKYRLIKSLHIYASTFGNGRAITSSISISGFPYFTPYPTNMLLFRFYKYNKSVGTFYYGKLQK